jgi:hypothetical protein
VARRRRLAIEHGGADDEDVHQPVVVDVEDGHARSRGLEQVALALGPAGHDEGGEPGVVGDVAVVHGDRRQ